MYIIKYFKNNLNIGYKSIIIILKKAPTPKVDAPKVNRYMSLWTPLTLWTDRVSILFTLISLIEKGDNRYNQATKGH